MDGSWHRPIGVRGWTHVVFRRESDGARRVMSLDEMLTHLDAWDRTADRRASQRRVYRAGARTSSGVCVADRRAALAEAEQLRRRESDFASLDASCRQRRRRRQSPEKRVASSRDAAPAHYEAHADGQAAERPRRGSGVSARTAEAPSRAKRERVKRRRQRAREAEGSDDERGAASTTRRAERDARRA